jgi:hypothetical protein
MPIKPTITKKKKSNILRNKFHLLKTKMLKAAINKNKIPKTMKGVMPVFVLYASK